MGLGSPIGSDLISGTTNGSTLPEPWPPTEPEERSISFGSSISLEIGKTYAIVIRATAADFSNRALWQVKVSGGYASGARYTSSDSGSTWSSTADDMWFKARSTGITKDSYTFAYAGSGANLYGSTWVAQTFLATSDYDITGVILRLYRWSGASPGTITVSIRLVSGIPINPVPADVAIGIAISTPQLSWEDGGGNDTYDVYFGPTGNMTLRSSTQADVTWTIPAGLLAGYSAVYQWRIDANVGVDTFTGDTWSFTTLVFAPPVPSGDGDEYGGEGGKNLMRTVRRLLVAAANKIYYEDE